MEMLKVLSESSISLRYAEVCYCILLLCAIISLVYKACLAIIRRVRHTEMKPAEYNASIALSCCVIAYFFSYFNGVSDFISLLYLQIAFYAMLLCIVPILLFAASVPRDALSLVAFGGIIGIARQEWSGAFISIVVLAAGLLWKLYCFWRRKKV